VPTILKAFLLLFVMGFGAVLFALASSPPPPRPRGRGVQEFGDEFSQIGTDVDWPSAGSQSGPPSTPRTARSWPPRTWTRTHPRDGAE
jgi:hypothetical protein